MSGGESSPPRLFDRALRRRRMARAAPRFAAHDFLHAFAADLVAERLLDVTRPFQHACIWGDRGRHLLARLPPGKIAAATYADPVPTLPGPSTVADLEASPFADGAFDLVVSLLDLHATNDPVGALIQIARSLRPDGLVIAVLFGADTLAEIRAALADAEVETTGGLSPRVFPFADVRDAGALLQRAGFALPVADADRLTVRYGDPLRLLADLRGAGETNVLTARRIAPMRRDHLVRALDLYRSRHAEADGKVPAHFWFLTLTGWTPHDSQQAPLKPGAGRVPLGAALEAVRKSRSSP